MSASHAEASSVQLESARGIAQRACSEMVVDGFDVVLECTGVEESTQTAIYVCAVVSTLTRRLCNQAATSGGRVVLVGMGTPVQTLPISATALREVGIVEIFRYANTYLEAIEMLVSFEHDLPTSSKLITHRLSCLDGAEAVSKMASRPQDENSSLILKVLVEGNKKR